MSRGNPFSFAAKFSRSTTNKRDKRRVMHKAVANAVEFLENRQMMSAYTPSQVRSAYGIDSISLGGTTGDGSGQTIAIVIPYYNSKLTGIADTVNGTGSVDEFNQFYGLQRFQNGGTVTSGPKLTVLNESGTTSPLPSGNSAWDDEEALDVEWAHAVAPQANIVLVAASSASDTDLFAANQTAAGYNGTGGNVSVVSNSWSEAEPSATAEATDDGYFVTPSGHQNVTFLAAAGDEAAYNGSYSAAHSSYPSVSPNVISVGGTSLSINTLTGAWSSEGAWQYSINSGNGHTAGGGGGISLHESQPSYQTGTVNGASTTNRTTPDVSMDADPNTGMYIFDYADTTAPAQPFALGGTSFATPMWAGLVAIVDQGRQILNGGTPNPLSTSQAQSAIYAASPSFFHDVTTGNNGYVATGGYDMATGRGTPIANLLVPGLAGYGATHLEFASPPTISIQAGVSALPALTVNVEDSTGSVLTSDASTVTLSVYNSMGENIGILGGTVTAVNGVATFANPWLSPPTHISGTYTLEASDSSALATTLNFAVTANSAVTSSPSTIRAFTTGGTPLEGSGPTNLVMDSSGNIYGTTEGGGSGNGTIFEIAAVTNTFSTLADFSGSDGSDPIGELAIDSAGNLFGTTATGGANTYGTLFELASGSGTITTLHSFGSVSGDGHYPLGGVVIDASGNIYGTTSADSIPGTIFKYNTVGTPSFNTIHTFAGTDGRDPEGGLVQDAAGYIYGTTTGYSSGGSSLYGSVFKFFPSTGALSTIGIFDYGNGSNPNGPLSIDSAGNIYGATQAGGTLAGGGTGNGTIFEIKNNGSNIVTTLATFASTFSDPSTVYSGVKLDRNGNLFFTSYNGASNSLGGIFELPAGSVAGIGLGTPTLIYPFDGTYGSYPKGNLLLDSHGNIFSTTSMGGAHGRGTVFELSSVANPIWLQPGSYDTWSNSTQTLTPTGTAWMDANPSDYGDLPIVTASTGASQVLRIGPTNGDTTVDIDTISLSNGAQVKVDKTPTNDALTINVNGLSVSGTSSTFDLNNSQMYIDYGTSTSPLSTIQGYVGTGWASQLWNGYGISSTAAAVDHVNTAIGYSDLATNNAPLGFYANKVLVRYTLRGDADLNGSVNSNDLQILLNNFNQSGKDWVQGDFNFDGSTNSNDLQDILNHFNTSI